MNDQKAIPESGDADPAREPDGTDASPEAEMAQQVLDVQQQRREGGSDLELSAITDLE